MALLGIIGPMELILILVVASFFFLFPLVALVDIIRSKFEGNMQLIWVIIVVFFNVIGTILYFIIGRNQKVHNQDSNH
jgi:hypothetical protein